MAPRAGQLAQAQQADQRLLQCRQQLPLMAKVPPASCETEQNRYYGTDIDYRRGKMMPKPGWP